MRLIRLIFWLGVSVILAYFMTDIRVGGMTIKERIDRVVGPGRAKNLVNQVKDWVMQKVGGITYEPPLSRQPAEEGGKNEEITNTDSEELKKVIEQNQ